MKVKKGISLPSIGIPGVFMKMNSLLQNSIKGMNLKDINPELPSGIITVKEGYLRSLPIPAANKCFLSGRFDVVSELDDGTFSVIDFKITDPKEEKVIKFKHQLHAYKFALENPERGEKKRVSKMGVVVVSPEQIGFKNGFIFFKATPKWTEIPEDMDEFYGFIQQVTDVLEGDIPLHTQTCQWCEYRKIFENMKKFNTEALKEEDIPF